MFVLIRNRVVSVVLALCFLVSLFPSIELSTKAYTHNELSYTIESDGIMIIDCDTDVVNIKIPSTIDGKAVTKIHRFAFNECYYLESVTIPESVSYIDDGAFSGCISLRDIKFGDNIDYLGSGAFYGTFYYNKPSNWENGLLYLGNYLIGESLEGVTKVSIKEGTTHIISGLFQDNNSIQSVEFPESLINIGGSAFRRCTSLKTIDLPKGVKKIGGQAFQECTALTEVNIGEGCERIGYSAFYGCTKLESISIPSTVTEIDTYVLAKCNKLKKVTLPFVGKNKDASDCFGYLFAISDYKKQETMLPETLKEVVITAPCEQIPDYAFYGCKNINKITLPATLKTSGLSAFGNCSGLTQLHISSIEDWLKVSFLMENSNPIKYAENLYVNNELLTNLVIPESVTKISNYAFIGCKSITNVDIHNNVKAIGISAFDECRNLKEIVIPDSVETIGTAAFESCSNAESIVIGAKVKTIPSDAFGWCSSVKTITFRGMVQTINNEAFSLVAKYNIDVYYPGTSEDWNAITFGHNNEDLINANIKFGVAEHNWSWIIDKEATCNAVGYKHAKCLDCGIENHFDTEIPFSNEHSWDWVIDLEPTCDAPGSKYQKCVNCGTNKQGSKRMITAAHTWQWVIEKPASCFTDGSKYEDCINCDATRNLTVIPASSAHVWEWVIDKEATCTEDGIKHEQCKKGCDSVRNKNTKIPAKQIEHTWKIQAKTTVKPTCEHQGEVCYECENCVEKLVKSVSKTQHEFGDWETTKEATNSSQGIKIRKCKTCEDFETELIPQLSCESIDNAKITGIESKTYSGEKVTLSLTLKVGKQELENGKDYVVSYKNNLKPGNAQVVIKGINSYKGSVTKTFKITPKKTKVNSLKSGKKSFTIKYKKQTSGSGYEIQYSTSKKFKSAKTVKITKNKTVSKTVKKLKAKKTYYVRVRTVKGSCKSAWSKASKVKTK